MIISKKKRCWSCDSLDVIKWGKQQGKQRFKCKNCGILFTFTNQGVSRQNRFKWFKDWVLGRQTIIQISHISGYSPRTLQSYFDYYLSKRPVLHVRPSEKLNLLMDGTYFANKLCLILYRDNTIRYTQLYRITDGEWYDEIKEDIANLLALGVQIESITCDGHKSVLKAIRSADKSILIQRCVVHVQRMCKIWLTLNPKSEAGFELLAIVKKLHRIETRNQWGYWVVELIAWNEKHKAFIAEKSFNSETGRFWYKHKMVRRSFVVIKRALPDMFHYLDNPRIPKSTNGLESFFGHLKSHLAIHRGLTKNHFKGYIQWYLWLKNQK
ncbi:IS256 family transposase, variant Zn-binding type [Alkaliflexus imshenetskii]|jgi:hypothetical protein|uniref:IS256 family transposase, variant Zn-binding type n=1 Tax=Alkaliflexus imshenetskii TaxID=286730 RepID=UPI0004B4E9A9|nr:transposase [Alkaliflexus imshenetskii]